MIHRLFNRFFVCRKVGHSPGARGFGAPPASETCMRCGGHSYIRRRKWAA